MAETAAAGGAGSAAVVQQDGADFDRDFGLEANEFVEAEPVAADAEALAEEADQLQEIEDADDNLDLLQRRQARAERAQERAEKTTRDPFGLPSNAEEPEEEAPEAEGAEEEQPESEAEADPEAEADGEELNAEQAQAYLDHLLEKFGGELKLRYKANGEEKESTLAELRERIAPGYMGQDGVHRTFQQVTQLRQEAEAQRQYAEQVVQAAREDLVGYLQAPDRYVEDFVLPQGGIEAVARMHEALEKTLREYESDPGTFGLRRQVDGLTRLVQQIAGAGQAHAAPAPAAAAEPDRSGTVPEDYGFVPGRGYPDAYMDHAFHALKAASKVAGVDVGEVVELWKQGGRTQGVFDVLDGIVAQRRQDAPKVALAAKPPIRALPKNPATRAAPAKPKSAAAPFASIESELTRELEKAFGGR